MKYLTLLFTLLLVSCSNVPQSVRDGTELPTTLEMCHNLYIDANDRNYNSDLEIKHLKAEIEELKKAHK